MAQGRTSGTTIFKGVADPFALLPPRETLAKLPPNALQYTDPSGAQVKIDPAMDDFDALGEDEEQWQAVFRNLICTDDRCQRAKVSVAYLVLIDQPTNAVHMMCAMGHTEAVMELARIEPEKFHAQDGWGRSPLYLAARSGYVDLCAYLISTQRCAVDAPQGDGSTPLHGACFYRHIAVIELLLEAGSNPSIRNDFDRTPAEDIADTKLRRKLFKNAGHALATFKRECVGTAVVGPFSELVAHETSIGYVAKRASYADVQDTTGYEIAFHGTEPSSVKSILINGLRPSGSKLPDGTTIKPLDGHLRRHERFADVDGWADATFVSPSVTYAAHPSYAGTVHDADNTQYHVVIICRVKPGSYCTHASTVNEDSHTPMEGEVHTEYRVAPTAPARRVATAAKRRKVRRCESEPQNVVVVGVLLLRNSCIRNLPSWATLAEFNTIIDRVTENVQRPEPEKPYKQRRMSFCAVS